jgi:hypothetical protein
MFGRSARDAVFAIVILAAYVIGAKNQATVAILDTSESCCSARKSSTHRDGLLSMSIGVQFRFL